MSLKYLKGLRTKYSNLITKELDKCKTLYTDANSASNDDIIDIRRAVSAALIKLKEYNAKLESTCEKIAIELDSIDDDKEKKMYRKSKTTLPSSWELLLKLRVTFQSWKMS